MTGPVSPEERDRRIAAANRRAALGLALDGLEAELPLWYLSFVDEAIAAALPEADQRPGGPSWLGGCFVPAPDGLAAVGAAHMLGCNPGGQVAMMGPIPRAKVRPELVGRLLSRAEVEDSEVDP